MCVCCIQSTVFHSSCFLLVGDAEGLNGLQIFGVAEEGGDSEGRFYQYT